MKNKETLKIKPIECFIHCNQQKTSGMPIPNPFRAKLDLYTGEVKFTNTSILFSYIEKMTFVFANQDYSFPLTSLGGKLFVENHKNLSPFDQVNGLRNLQRELTIQPSIPKAKL